MGRESGYRDLSRLSGAADAALYPDDPDRGRVGTEELALVNGSRLSVLHHSVLHLAPGRVFQVDSLGHRRTGNDRRLQSFWSDPARCSATFATRDPDGGCLLHRTDPARVHLRPLVCDKFGPEDDQHRRNDRTDPGRCLFLASADGRRRNRGHSDGLPLQPVPRPFYRGLHAGRCQGLAGAVRDDLRATLISGTRRGGSAGSRTTHAKSQAVSDRTPYYITTAIDYPNAAPHIGHSFEKISADVVARYHRLRGDDVVFCMGLDENSQHIVTAAATAGVDVKTFTDQMDDAFLAAWRALKISVNAWTRTTEPRHAEASIELFKRAVTNGDIYKSKYAGW